MNQTFTVDQSKINNIRKRAILRNGKILGVVFLFIFIPQFWQRSADMQKSYLLSFLFSIPLWGLIIYLGSNKLVKAYRTLEIILSDTGVELKAEMILYKKIAWQDLKINEKSNGIIILYDKRVSGFNRYMFGKGCIIVQPEIINRLDLLNVVQKRIYHG